MALIVLALFPAGALAHAQLVRSTPQAESAGNASPATVRMEFTEPVTLLKAADVEVVNRRGESVAAGAARVTPGDVKAVEIPVRPGLPDGTYTVRYRVVSADSHVIPGAYPFAVGDGPVGPPFLGGPTSTGPGMTSPWLVTARFLELVGLGGLLGLTAFRWLVWRPAWGSRWVAGIADDARAAGLEWGRDAYWTAFGALAVGSMVAETYLLVTYSASALGTSVADALTNTSGISTVLSTTRLGALVQVRGALLFALFAVGIWAFLSEFGSGQQSRPATATPPRAPAALMAALVVAVLYGIAAQGHASQAPVAPAQIAADLGHMCAGAVWGAGLVAALAAMRRLPARMPSAGARASTAVLAAFSRVALWAIVAIVLTGVVRTLGEIDAVDDLWRTTWGKVLVAKVAVLGLAGLPALHNRRVVATLERRGTTSAVGLARVRRAVLVEIAASLAIVALAALLVAEVPGRL